MRSQKLVVRALVVIAVIAGCGSSDAGSGDAGNNAGAFDVDKLLRACTVLHSCSLNYDIGECVFDFNRNGTPAQVDCVLAASVANCDAANACIGAKRAPDTNCVERCLDDATFVQCNGPSMHTEITCAKYLQSGGPSCITSGTSIGCGVATCSADGQFTCAGTVSHSCGGGIERMSDCARVGTECTTTTPGCQLPTSGPCMPTARCDGDLLPSCDATGAQRVEDCSKVVPGGTCIIVNGFTACGWAMECNVGSSTEVCDGATLRACVLGALKDIDCTKIGGTTCRPDPNTGMPRCSL